MADAAILEIENLQYIGNRSSDCDEILHEKADQDRKPWGRWKFAYFKNPRWRTAAILDIEKKLQYLGNCSSDRDEILHEQADHDHKASGM